MEHYLKCWPEYFQAVKNGEKPFEVRKWDRPYAIRDTLVLQEYDPKRQEYTGDYVLRQITYMLDMTYLPGDRTPHYSGYVVMGLSAPGDYDAIMEMACLRAELARERERAERAESEINRMAQSMAWPDLCAYCKAYVGEDFIRCKDNCFFEWRGKDDDHA